VTEDAFPDRRDCLFARASDVRRLLDRAAKFGLTAIVGRPRMGKTWTLNEVARQLVDDGRYIVGYHDFKGGESSHLLYAVADLYARWLTDAQLRQQALAGWSRLRPTLIPRIGQVVGELLGTLGGSVLPGGVALLVKAAFDKLIDAQRNSQGGGMQIPTLPYDEAKQLMSLVADVSGRRVVLILDAWEKSLAAPRSDLHTVEAVLRNDIDWQRIHVFAAVRHPELHTAEMEQKGYREAIALCQMFPCARRYELAALDQADDREMHRMLAFLRDRVPAARRVEDERLLDLIDGYPGVLDHWVTGANRTEMHSEADLRSVAGDAQANRYPELEHLLAGLDSSARPLAAAVAFLPGLDEATWSQFREILLASGSGEVVEDLVNELIDLNVFVDAAGTTRFANYGHDTRHAVARRWFMRQARPLMRREAQRIILALASRFTGADLKSFYFLRALMACSETAMEVGVGAAFTGMVEATRWVFDGSGMSSLDSDFGGPPAHQSCPALIAWARYNRAVWRGEQGDVAAELTDYDAVIALRGAPTEVVAKGLLNRALTRGKQGDMAAEVADYDALIALPGAPVAQVAKALFNRALTHGQYGDVTAEVADYDALIMLPGAPAEPVAMALFNRALTRREQGDVVAEVADYDALITLPGAPAELVAKTLFSRALRRGQQRDVAAEVADYDAVIALPGAPAEQVAKALFNRALKRAQQGDVAAEVADYDAVIALPGAPTEQVAKALFNRALTRGQQGDAAAEVADYDALIALSGAPAEHVAKALFNRAVKRGQQGDIAGEVADYDALIALPDAPAELVQKLRNIRSNKHD
jgi:F0F1-type ATP synthase delta subunit